MLTLTHRVPDIYKDKCPTPNDPAEAYFSRSDVQTALHVPNFGQWSECSARSPFRNGDNSPYTETLFPSILKQIPITSVQVVPRTPQKDRLIQILLSL
jgi:hypothetical protein